VHTPITLFLFSTVAFANNSEWSIVNLNKEPYEDGWKPIFSSSYDYGEGSCAESKNEVIRFIQKMYYKTLAMINSEKTPLVKKQDSKGK
jgi:hypothetical protein